MIEQLLTVKNDIKSALSEKGVSPIGGMITYAESIRNIKTGFDFPLGTKFAWSGFVEAPLYDTSGMEDFSEMFKSCKNLKTIPQYNTSNAKNFWMCFQNCDNLEYIPLLDCSSVEVFHPFGSSSFFPSSPRLGGFRNLGKSISDDRIVMLGESYYNVNFADIDFSRESLVNVFNELYDLNVSGREPLTIWLGGNASNLTDEDIAIVVGKGWVVKG